MRHGVQLGGLGVEQLRAASIIAGDPSTPIAVPCGLRRASSSVFSPEPHPRSIIFSSFRVSAATEYARQVPRDIGGSGCRVQDPNRP